MSSLKVGKIQSGISLTPANNMVLDASADDGTFTFKREDGSVLFTVDATGKIDMDGTGIFQKDNILGTVSETLGVPTGAVIERGSNANGEYVKFADGTLICTYYEGIERLSSITSESSYITVNLQHTYPVAFIAAPALTPYCNGNVGQMWGKAQLITTTNMYMLGVGTSAGATGYLGYIAIGRWF